MNDHQRLLALYSMETHDATLHGFAAADSNRTESSDTRTTTPAFLTTTRSMARNMVYQPTRRPQRGRGTGSTYARSNRRGTSSYGEMPTNQRLHRQSIYDENGVLRLESITWDNKTFMLPV